MDETTEDHHRYCPSCSGWVREDELQVPADGKPRHRLCGTITALRAPVPSEMRELAGRMAADESAEGNFAAAAELKAFAEDAPDNVVGTAAEDIQAGGTGTMNLSPMSGLPAWMTGRDANLRADIKGAVAGGSGTVMLGGQLEALTTTASWRAAFAADLRRLLPQVTGAKLHADHVVALAGAFVDAGWVPGARRRAAELPKATAEQVPKPLRSRLAALADPDRYEELPIEDVTGAVIGHVWEVQSRYCLEHEREWVAAVDGDSSNRPRFGSRDDAERWVRANALRDGRPLTVPYDAEKVLGIKSEVIGWVWPDPEHAGGDGRWLAVHGAAPEHQHPLFGAAGSGLDSRNQAIGWVLEQDKTARRG